MSSETLPRPRIAAAPVVQANARRETRAWCINVLVVEDDLADASLIMDVLKRHPSVAYAQATDAPELALRQLASGHLSPDLILLDIRMPRLDGFEFLDRLRRIPAMLDTPVAFLTTSAFAGDVLEAKHSSACSYVVKPETYEELKERLGKVIKTALSGAWSR
ncbi:MAG TPA: response regulator [Caulobacteraceae bacterium]|nr:response regulator [Caulobacteraceae bacterium]